MGFGSREKVEAVGDDGGAARTEVLGVGEECGGEGNREIGAAEEKLGEKAFGRGGVLNEPFAEADGVPVKDQCAKERSTEEHREPVTIERSAFGGRGDVVERHRSVAKTEPKRVEAGGEKGENLGGSPAADVGGVAREAGVDVVEREVGSELGEVG